MTGLHRRDDVFVLTLGDDENRFHPDRLAAINAALDEVDAAPGPKAVVTTGVGKFYSNGLDLDFMGANPDAAEANLRDVHALLDCPVSSHLGQEFFVGVDSRRDFHSRLEVFGNLPYVRLNLCQRNLCA